MPTPKKGYRLGGSSSHQKAILNNLATSLFEHGRITTTEAKARMLRPFAERLITKAKKGDLHNRRIVLRAVKDKGVVHTLFTEIGPQFAERPGWLHPHHQDRPPQGRQRPHGGHRAGDRALRPQGELGLSLDHHEHPGGSGRRGCSGRRGDHRDDRTTPPTRRPTRRPRRPLPRRRSPRTRSPAPPSRSPPTESADEDRRLRRGRVQGLTPAPHHASKARSPHRGAGLRRTGSSRRPVRAPARRSARPGAVPTGSSCDPGWCRSRPQQRDRRARPPGRAGR